MTSQPSTKTIRSGTLATDNVLEVFKEAAARVGRVTLLVRNGAEQRILYFDNGRVRVHALGSTRTYQRLIHLGLVTDRKVEDARQIQEQDRRALTDILVELGAVTQEQVEIILTHQSTEDLQELLSWPGVDFEVVQSDDSDIEMGQRLRGQPDFECKAVLQEAARRAQEWERVLEKIFSIDEIFVSRPGGDCSSLSDDQRAILGAVDGKRTVRELFEATVLSRYECAYALRDLYERKLVALANHIYALNTAEACLQRGDNEHVPVILQPLLERPEANDLETMLHVGALLERCDKHQLAAEALMHAARLDQGVRALELARQASELAPHFVDALELIHEELRRQGETDGEREDVSRRLIHAYINQERLADALSVLEELKKALPDDTGLLHRQASILYKLGRQDEALHCLLQLAADLETTGDRRHLERVYQQILKIDRRQADVKHALAQLRGHGLIRLVARLGRAVCGLFRSRSRSRSSRPSART